MNDYSSIKWIQSIVESWNYPENIEKVYHSEDGKYEKEVYRNSDGTLHYKLKYRPIQDIEQEGNDELEVFHQLLFLMRHEIINNRFLTNDMNAMEEECGKFDDYLEMLWKAHGMEKKCPRGFLRISDFRFTKDKGGTQ